MKTALSPIKQYSQVIVDLCSQSLSITRFPEPHEHGRIAELVSSGIDATRGGLSALQWVHLRSLR
jgi:hypothetical protein